MDRNSVAALVALGCVSGGISNAAAAVIPFGGTIESATWSSVITGSLSPAIVGQSYSGLIGTDQQGDFFATLNLPLFEVDLPGCGQVGSGCSDYRSPRTYTVTDAGGMSSSHSFQQTGDRIDFSVFNPAEGGVSGTFVLDASAGQITADNLYAGQAFRADDRSELDVTLSVGAVPLPAALPMFGGALLGLGALAWRKRLAGAP